MPVVSAHFRSLYQHIGDRLRRCCRGGGAENASTGKRKYGKSKYESAGMENVDIVSGWEGATENARHEFAAPTCKGGKCETRKCGTKLQGWKMREKLV